MFSSNNENPVDMDDDFENPLTRVRTAILDGSLDASSPFKKGEIKA